MKTKKLFLAAVALVALASCSSDEFVGDSSLQGSGEMPISFGFDVPTVTRASGADAATKLGNRFIVYAEKGEITSAAPTSGNLVFPNYQVNYAASTANTTTSNTKDWEYVGYTHSTNYQTNITSKASSDVTATNASDAAQTIKYWDYGADHYIFTAVSALDADIENGRVKIQKNEYGTTEYDKGYTITLAKTTAPETYPNLSDIYISDRLVIDQSSGSDRNAVNAYGGNVTLTFRNLLSQVRAGVYETIPGYYITSIKFYVTNDADAKIGDTPAFGAIYPNVKIGGGFEGTLNVTYYNAGTAKNQPQVAVDGSGSAADLILGTNMSTLTKSTSGALGITAADPTWDTAAGAYTNVLPQSVGNTDNLKLKCDYTLWNNITGETIEVTGATAEIPSQYLQWKSNFKYTYLFKISDNTNGQTGTGTPAGLYPITFDAVEMVSGDGIAEYITTVSEPSITTFGVNSTGNYVAEHGTTEPYYDYPASTTVYAVVEDGSSLATLNTSNMKLYTVTTSDATHSPITAASVAEALIENPTMTTAQVGNAKIVPTVQTLTDDNYLRVVPAEDGTTKTLDETNNKAVKFTTAANTTYALVYEKTPATYTYDSGKNDYTEDSFAAAGKLYTRSGEAGSYTYTLASTFSSGTTYFKPTAVSSQGVYVIKIVNCPVTTP